MTSYLARATRCLNRINLAEIFDACEKRFHNLQKIVDGKLIPSLFDGERKREFHKFVSDVVREREALFCNYNVKSFNFDGFYMEYLKDSIHFKSFVRALKIVLTLFYGQVDFEGGFSLNKQLVVENISKISLIAQRFEKDHMLLHYYRPHNMLIAKELVRSVRNSNPAYKEALK